MNSTAHVRAMLASLVLLCCSAPLSADAIDDYVNVELARQHIPGAVIA